MTRKEALNYIKSVAGHLIATDRQVMGMALLEAWDALRQPGWVKTADRVPDISEGDFDALIVWPDQTHNSLHRYGLYNASEILAHPKRFLAYMPLPPLPENVGLEGTKSNGGE